jgi:hypothetical protein
VAADHRPLQVHGSHSSQQGLTKSKEYSVSVLV